MVEVDAKCDKTKLSEYANLDYDPSDRWYIVDSATSIYTITNLDCRINLQWIVSCVVEPDSR